MTARREMFCVKETGSRLTYYKMPNNGVNCQEYLQCPYSWNCGNCDRIIKVRKAYRKTSPEFKQCTRNKKHYTHRNKLQRRRRMLSRLITNIKDIPCYFMTANTDLRLSKANLETAKKWFKKLFTALKYRYNGISSIYKLEVDERKRLHVHSLLYFKNDCPDIELLQIGASLKWRKIRGWCDANCMSIEEYRHISHRAYLCHNTDKWDDDMLLTLVAWDKDTFGWLGKSNVRLHKTKRYIITRDELDKYIRPLGMDLVLEQSKYRSDCLPNERTIRMLEGDSGTLYDVPIGTMKKITGALQTPSDNGT